MKIFFLPSVSLFSSILASTFLLIFSFLHDFLLIRVHVFRTTLVMNHIILMLGVGGMLFGCEPSDSYQYDPFIRVKVVTISASKKSEGLYYPAVASVAEHSKLSFRLAGEVIDVDIKEGEKVKNGQVLARIDPKDYTLKVADAKATFYVIDSQYRRSKLLVKKTKTV